MDGFLSQLYSARHAVTIATVPAHTRVANCETVTPVDSTSYQTPVAGHP